MTGYTFLLLFLYFTSFQWGRKNCRLGEEGRDKGSSRGMQKKGSEHSGAGTTLGIT